ncbi:prepilin peptidase [Pseudoalteromonas xiamenensis]|uniref:Prepilin leader peptidase/N-methyltransferase n=1 Tax=Pseudoalteromonas xiamenensis TaxID=882626 RepID=A0A975HLW6_9GAMM|nr:A24 family peptidase [Pseudoalteromonas xiamenensis]QTH72474.1 prepilin peptidase [Pseudoalteromonas xiamenensis]
MLELFTNTLTLLQTNLAFYVATVGLVSLCIGSFLNVVIYRLPIQLQREWQTECKLLLAEHLTDTNEDDNGTTFNLAFPNSHCPKCQASLKWWHNIPLVSWLLLKGRRGFCQTSISIRYPLIETLTATLSVLVAWYFGPTEKALLYIVISWALIALTFIDIDHMLLPDQITLPLVWAALLASTLNITIEPQQAIIGAAIGYLSLWSVFWLFKLLTGKEGMGYGDFKLMAVFGGLLGWEYILQIVLLSSVVGAFIGSVQLAVQGKNTATPIPFGPYIAAAGWIAMLFGPQIQSWYFGMLQL